MSRPDRDVEIIELLPADGGARPDWFQPAGDGSLPSTRELGRAGALIGALVIAGVVAGVIAAVATSATDDRAAVPPAPSSTPPGVVATVPAPLTPVDPAADGVFVLDDPSLRPYAADITSPPDDRDAFWLWASVTSTAVVTVHVTHAPAASVFFVDAVRRVVEGVDLVSPRTDPAVTSVVVDLGDRGSATVWTLGMSDAQIVSVRRGLVVHDSTSIDIESPALAELGLQHTMSARTVQELLQGAVRTESRYLGPNGEMITLDVGGSVADSTADALRLFTTDVMTTNDGRIAGRLRGSTQSMALWMHDGHALGLTAALAPSQLLDLSRTVRGGTMQEWRGLIAALHPDFVLGRYAVLAQLAPGTDDGWRAGVQHATRGGRPQFLLWWTQPGTPDANDSVLVGDLTDGPTVSYVVVRGATYVFVSQPLDAGDGTVTVTVNDSGGRPHVVQLRQPFDDQPLLIGVTRVDTPGPLTVRP